MLTEERIETIYIICQLWAGIDRKMFDKHIAEQNITKEEQEEYMQIMTVYCSTCKLPFNVECCHYCDNCGGILPLPENLFLLELKNRSMLNDEHAGRMYGKHTCDGKKFCRHCGHPK